MYKLQYTLYYEKVIRNNIAVCLLYLGRLKEGLQLLENSITADPTNIQVGCLTLPLSETILLWAYCICVGSRRRLQILENSITDPSNIPVVTPSISLSFPLSLAFFSLGKAPLIIYSGSLLVAIIFILDGNSEIGKHAMSNLGYFICLRHYHQVVYSRTLFSVQ